MVQDLTNDVIILKQESAHQKHIERERLNQDNENIALKSKRLFSSNKQLGMDDEIRNQGKTSYYHGDPLITTVIEYLNQSNEYNALQIARARIFEAAMKRNDELVIELFEKIDLLFKENEELREQVKLHAEAREFF